MIWKEGLQLREWTIFFIESVVRNPKLLYIFCDAWFFNDNDKTLNTERKKKQNSIISFIVLNCLTLITVLGNHKSNNRIVIVAFRKTLTKKLPIKTLDVILLDFQFTCALHHFGQLMSPYITRLLSYNMNIKNEQPRIADVNVNGVEKQSSANEFWLNV